MGRILRKYLKVWSTFEVRKADLKESKEESEDPFVRQLQKTIEKIKSTGENGGKIYGFFKEMLSERKSCWKK